MLSEEAGVRRAPASRLTYSLNLCCQRGEGSRPLVTPHANCHYKYSDDFQELQPSGDKRPRAFIFLALTVCTVCLALLLFFLILIKLLK